MSVADDMIDDWLMRDELMDDELNIVSYPGSVLSGHYNCYSGRRKFRYSDILDRDIWFTNGIYCEVSQLTEAHILAIMSYLQQPKTVQRLQSNDLVRYVYSINSRGAYPIKPEEYIEIRIKDSALWLALTEALEIHQKLKDNANNINRGVLEI